METWKDIKGYEGLYQVSNLGRVRSMDRYVGASHGSTQLRKGMVMRLTQYPNGYIYVQLCKDAKYTGFYVHRLVASAFLDNPDNLREVNHKDRDKTNNAVTNLEWCTRSYNTKYLDAAKKRAEKYAKAVVVYGPDGEKIGEFQSCTQAAKHFGKWKRTILGYLWGEHKNRDGYTFQYKS